MDLSGKKFESPEEVLKVLQTGAGGDFLAGGALDAEQQREFLKYIRAYGVMIAPHYQDLSQFPGNSPIGRAASARFQGGGTNPMGPGLVPGGARMITHNSGAISGTYDSMFVTDTITRGAFNDGAAEQFVQEGQQDASGTANLVGNYGENPVKFGRRQFNCVKLRSSYAATTEFFVQSIVNGRLNADLSAALAPRIVHDFEDLAINGDTTLAGASKRQRLLRSNDGWVRQSLAESQVVDGGGGYITWDHFMYMVKSLPEEYVMSDYKFWMHPHLWSDWLSFLAARAQSSEATSALGGNGLAPLGIPVCLVPLMPRNRQIDAALAGGAPAVVRGNEPGPFIFRGGVADAVSGTQMGINVNGIGNLNIAFPDGLAAGTAAQDRLIPAARAASIINAALVADGQYGSNFGSVARVGEGGCLELRAPNLNAAGAAVASENTSIAVIRFGANDQANEHFGIPHATAAAGVAQNGAGAGDVSRDGSLVWLSPAENFCWHVTTAEPGSSSNGIRMFTKFEQEVDRVITDVYSYQDATLTSPHAMVTLDQIRVARPGEDPTP